MAVRFVEILSIRRQCYQEGIRFRARGQLKK